MVKVVNKGPSALCLRADLGSAGVIEIDLEVGATEVDDAKLVALLEASAPSAQLFDLQCEVTTDAERDPDEGTQDFVKGRSVNDLSKLKQPEALKAIAACKSSDQLRAWVLTDARQAVKKALHLRDRELRPPEANDETAISRT